MNKYIVMVVVALVAIGEPVANAADNAMAEALLSKCYNYTSAVVNDSMLLGSWRLVESTTDYTCTTLTIYTVLDVVLNIPPNPIVVNLYRAQMAYYENGVPKSKIFAQTRIKAGHYVLKQLPTQDPVNQTMTTLYLVYVNVSSDTLMTTMCPLLNTTTYQAFQIYTKDGSTNPTVKVFEDAARANGIPMAGLHDVDNSDCQWDDSD